MKITILIFCLLSAAVSGFAQNNHQQKNDSVCKLIKKYWAEKNADAIYAMAGEEFKQQLSLADFKTACTKNLFPMGNMKTTFENFENETSKYKAIFTSDSLSFYLGLDNKNKLATFSFKPYEK
jgi:hypothetical protein